MATFDATDFYSAFPVNKFAFAVSGSFPLADRPYATSYNCGEIVYTNSTTDFALTIDCEKAMRISKVTDNSVHIPTDCIRCVRSIASVLPTATTPGWVTIANAPHAFTGTIDLQAGSVSIEDPTGWLEISGVVEAEGWGGCIPVPQASNE
jgi:hypothetical protein